ncbi:MAG TPA: SctK family type III secretion system sorting platform protein [Ramlibacter sp.]|uniref:SctK family type III secretion system sorting platform protein n=1 Tax=Ramlibacter sp. TaxID=1917967 RepID=UPI002C3CEF4D|nr:SctK family type III secretion system sorting platform protein [Ramlibacter sp.]HVZ45018.1 SctK family type III secretion system sorting platform protein [Ramlibacter sp.]
MIGTGQETPPAGAAAEGWVRLIGERADVARGICLFNQNPADYIDESRREEFFPPALDAGVWRCERSRRHLSRHILQRIGEGCLELRRPEWPVALLARERLDRLCLHVTAALVGARVRRCISRVDVLKWREWLSQEAHEFALTRAGLLPATATEPTVVIEDTTALDVGRAWVVAASRGWAEPTAKRFMLKLPAGDFPRSDALDGASAWRLVSSVLAIVESRWYSSFATIRD